MINQTNFNNFNCDDHDSFFKEFSNIDQMPVLDDQSKVVGSGRFGNSPNRGNRVRDGRKDVGSGRLSSNIENGRSTYDNPAQFYEEVSSLFKNGLKSQNPLDSAASVPLPVQVPVVPNDVSILSSLLNQLKIHIQDGTFSTSASTAASLANLSTARRSPTIYVCHICNKPGHDIKECPGVRPRTRCYTPYQGTKRCFGEFKCERCDRTWMSGNSWANESQLCKKCRLPCFPFRQASLNKPDGLDRSDQSRVHPQELCSRCKTLGYYCRSNNSTPYRCHIPQVPELPPAREPPFPIASHKSWSNRQL